MAAQRSLETLKHLYETGEYSDVQFKVECRYGKVRTFSVHKNIICASSKYFADICKKHFGVRRPDQQSSPSARQKAGPIELEDTEYLIDTAFRYLYGLEFKLPEDSTDVCLDMVYLREATAKFDIAGLNTDIEKTLMEYLQTADIATLVACGKGTLEADSGFSMVVSDELARLTALKLRSIMDDEDLWGSMCKSPNYVKKIMETLAESTDKVDEKIEKIEKV